MIKFEYQFDDASPKIEMTLDPASALPQVLQSFEAFLKASGYVFDGIVDIVSDDIDRDDIKVEEPCEAYPRIDQPF